MAEFTTPPLPRRLMGDVYWRFDGEPFASQAEFDAAIRTYQNENWGKSAWQPEAVVLLIAQVSVRPDVSGFNPAEAPAAVQLSADDGAAFTAGELLWKSHNAFVAVLRLRDHRYFEGFSLTTPEPGPPRYPDLDAVPTPKKRA